MRVVGAVGRVSIIVFVWLTHVYDLCQAASITYTRTLAEMTGLLKNIGHSFVQLVDSAFRLPTISLTLTDNLDCYFHMNAILPPTWMWDK